MTKQRVIIQDMNDPIMPVVTEMTVIDVRSITGDLLRFGHDDGTYTIINIAPGWNVTVSVSEEED